jgi:uncharacterized protein DUF4386
MTIHALTQGSISVESVAAVGSLKRTGTDGSRKVDSRLIGSLFLLGFASYGTGFGLVTSVVGVPDFLSTISAHRTTFVLGAFLMLLNSVVDVGKGVLFFPIMEDHGKRTALAYLAAMIVEVVLLAVGVLSLLLIVPLGRYAGADWATAVGSLLTESNTMAYQLAMMSLAVGNMLLWTLATRIRLLPRWLSVWGVLGYGIFLVGAIAEIFGVHIGMMCTVAGGLFEVVLGFWLLIKGFEPEAYGQSLSTAPAAPGRTR